LQDFRLFEEKLFEFSGNTTLIVGPNASGKTNLLEAIVFLATGKSFRAGKIDEVIRNDQDLARIVGRISDGNPVKLLPAKGPTASTYKRVATGQGLEVVLTRGEINGERVPRKKLLVNGVAKRLFNFAGNLRAVLFEPEDIELVIGSPSKRRDYLDFVLSQVDREYYRSLLSYEKGLRRRNKILLAIREGEARATQLEFWNRLLIKNGQLITEKREGFIKFLNEQLSDRTIEYDRSIISEARLNQYKDAEVGAGATLVGPHRDDFVISATSYQLPATSRNLAIYGSRGEQRMAVLLIKLAELEFVALRTGERPLLLLDDIFSELDKEHRKEILNIIPKQQTFITTTDINVADKRHLNKIEIIELR